MLKKLFGRLFAYDKRLSYWLQLASKLLHTFLEPEMDECVKQINLIFTITDIRMFYFTQLTEFQFLHTQNLTILIK